MTVMIRSASVLRLGEIYVENDDSKDASPCRFSRHIEP